MEAENQVLLYEEKIRPAPSYLVLQVGVGIVVLVWVVPQFLNSRTPEEFAFSFLFAAVASGFLVIIRPKRMRLAITPQEIVYSEGKKEIRLAISEVSDLVPCRTVVHGRAGKFHLHPWPGHSKEELESYKAGLKQGLERRNYSMNAGAAMAIRLSRGGVVLVPTNQPDKPIAIVKNVLHSRG